MLVFYCCLGKRYDNHSLLVLVEYYKWGVDDIPLQFFFKHHQNFIGGEFLTLLEN